jgi:hypothetical protein
LEPLYPRDAQQGEGKELKDAKGVEFSRLRSWFLFHTGVDKSFQKQERAQHELHSQR